MTPSDLAELQFFPALFGSILTEGVSDKQDSDAIACGEALGAAFRAPGTLVALRVRKAAQRPVFAAVAAFRAPLAAEGAPVALAALIADRLLGEIVSSGYLILYPGSDFDRAMGLIRPGLGDVVDDAMRERADEEWAAALERVRRTGLFGGVRVIEVDASEQMARAA